MFNDYHQRFALSEQCSFCTDVQGQYLSATTRKYIYTVYIKTERRASRTYPVSNKGWKPCRALETGEYLGWQCSGFLSSPLRTDTSQSSRAPSLMKQLCLTHSAHRAVKTATPHFAVNKAAARSRTVREVHQHTHSVWTVWPSKRRAALVASILAHLYRRPFALADHHRNRSE